MVSAKHPKIWGLGSIPVLVTTRYSGPTETGRGSRIIVRVKGAQGWQQRTFPFWHHERDTHEAAIRHTFETFGRPLIIERDYRPGDNNDRHTYTVALGEEASA